MILADEVKRLRIRANLTQGQLAEKIGVTQGQISHLETGKRGLEMTANILYRLCDALGVDCRHFRSYIEQDPEPPVPVKKPKKKGRG